MERVNRAQRHPFVRRIQSGDWVRLANALADGHCTTQNTMLPECVTLTLANPDDGLGSVASFQRTDPCAW